MTEAGQFAIEQFRVIRRGPREIKLEVWMANIDGWRANAAKGFKVNQLDVICFEVRLRFWKQIERQDWWAAFEALAFGRKLGIFHIWKFDSKGLYAFNPDLEIFPTWDESMNLMAFFNPDFKLILMN